MRKAKVYVDEVNAGLLVEEDDGYYSFIYDKDYLKYKDHPVSLTLPVRELPYKSKVFFSFFDGLIPEGWMLNILVQNWKLNPSDRMGLLLACCEDCIGNVKVKKYE
ncbi:MAG: HipA N-terminal domain-containing protein [Sphaerochaetaceae bacterium]